MPKEISSRSMRPPASLFGISKWAGQSTLLLWPSPWTAKSTWPSPQAVRCTRLACRECPGPPLFDLIYHTKGAPRQELSRCQDRNILVAAGVPLTFPEKVEHQD